MATGLVAELKDASVSAGLVGEPGREVARVRERYVDRLRTAMTVVVVFAHATMSYGGAGDWFYMEVAPSASFTSIVFALFNLTIQTFLMGLFFLLAGYFTPDSFKRKGARQFLLDRLLRLGVPLLLFGLILAPLTEGMASAAVGHRFWTPVLEIWHTRSFVRGPMWFAQALLLFSFAYAIWQALPISRSNLGNLSELGEHVARGGQTQSLPGQGVWILSAVGVGAAGWMLRFVFPLNRPRFGMWLGYFAGYIFLFFLGVAARRHRWFRQLAWRQVRPWLIVCCVTWPTVPLAIWASKKHHLNLNFNGGFSWAAILYAFWEPFVSWGIIAAALLWFRDRAEGASRAADWLGRRAYAVYFIHPPVLVGVSVLLRNWHSPGMVKCLCVTVIASVVAWLIGDPLVRLPGLRQIF